MLLLLADLTDSSGDFQLVLGVDDSIQAPHWRQRLRMPRRLLALLAVQCLLLRDEGQSDTWGCAQHACHPCMVDVAAHL